MFMFCLSSTFAQAKAVFDNSFYDAGKVKMGQKVKYEFVFTNTGDKPLIILDAAGSCGCTVGKYPKGPVLPGQSDKIRVIYDSYKQSGYQQKSVTITTNEPQNKHFLTIRIMVE